MLKRFIFLVCIYIATCPAVIVRAGDGDPVTDLVETMSLSDLMDIQVTSASFFDTTTNLTPGTPYVLDVEEATKGAFRTTRDLLYLDAPGIIVRQHSRHGTLLGMRGMWVDNNAKSLFMLDGHDLNPRNHYGYTAGITSPLLGDIQGLEIIRGPGAIRHGSGAINGFINYTPKNGTDSPGGFVTTEYGGQENLYRVETGYGKAYGKGKDLFVYAGIFDADGFVDDYPSSGYTDPADTINPGTKVHGQKQPGTRFSAYWHHGSLSWNTFFQETNSATNSDADERAEYWHSASFSTRPKITYEMTPNDSLEISAGLDLIENGRESLPENWTTPDGGGSERHLQIEGIYRTTRLPGHKLAMGFNAGHKKFKEKDQYFHSDYPNNFEAINMSWQEFSLFAEDQYQVMDNLSIIAGTRYDYETHKTENSSAHQDDLDNLSWRVAAALGLNNETTIKAEFQQGFRTPDAYYYNTLNWLNYMGGVTGLGDVYQLVPETMDSWSLSLIKEMFGKSLHLEATGFYNRYKNTLKYGGYQEVLSPDTYATLTSSFPGGGLYGFINSPQPVTAWGSELSLLTRLGKNTEIKGSYAYTRRGDETNAFIPYPRHIGKLGLGQYFLNQDLYVNGTGVYHSGHGDATGLENYLTAHNRVQVDLSVRYQATPALSLKILVQNLFKETVPPPVNWKPSLGGLGYDHRFWYLSMEYVF